jgi:hypothetical protein
MHPGITAARRSRRESTMRIADRTTPSDASVPKKPGAIDDARSARRMSAAVNRSIVSSDNLTTRDGRQTAGRLAGQKPSQGALRTKGNAFAWADTFRDYKSKIRAQATLQIIPEKHDQALRYWIRHGNGHLCLPGGGLMPKVKGTGVCRHFRRVVGTRQSTS